MNIRWVCKMGLASSEGKHQFGCYFTQTGFGPLFCHFSTFHFGSSPSSLQISPFCCCCKNTLCAHSDEYYLALVRLYLFGAAFSKYTVITELCFFSHFSCDFLVYSCSFVIRWLVNSKPLPSWAHCSAYLIEVGSEVPSSFYTCVKSVYFSNHTAAMT